MKRLFFILFLAAVALTQAVAADNLRFSILTCMPGKDIYELEGHAGIRICTIDGVTGKVIDDNVVDWGNFDFDAPNFVYRFVKGETDYTVDIRPTRYFLRYYASHGRRVYEQPLELDSLEGRRLIELLTDNFEPGKRVYRYNYIKDNCATRVIAMIERATGDTLHLAGSGLPATTFREAMSHYHVNYPWYQFGINLALGSSLDEPIPDRMMMFAPEALTRMLDAATYSDGRKVTTGTSRAVAGEDSVIDPPTPWYLTPMAATIAVLVIGMIFAVIDVRHCRLTRIYYSLLYTLYGMAGLILTFLIFISIHEATSPNWLYLWLNPLCFIPAIGVWVKKAKKLVICYQIVNFVLLMSLLIVFAAGVQHPDRAFYPLIAADIIASAVMVYIYSCSLRTHS